MKRPILLFLSIVEVILLNAQQDGYQTHFQFNEISYNPSYAGKADNKVCLSSLFHQQYLGFKSEAINDYANKAVIQPYRIAPQTEYFTLSARIYHRFGIAFHFMKDEIGPQEIKLPKLNLSWYLNSNNSHFAAGFSIGEMEKSLDGNALVPLSMLSPPFLPDPGVPQDKVAENKFDLGAGIHYLNQAFNNLNIGLSATHLLNSNFSFINSNKKQVTFSCLKTHYYLNSSMDFPLNVSQLVLQPNVLFKYGSIFQADINILAIYNTTFYGGFSFRQGDNVNMMIGYIYDEFKIGYAFDFVVSSLKPGTKTSHELIIQYCYRLSPKKNYLLNPRFLQNFPH